MAVSSDVEAVPWESWDAAGAAANGAVRWKLVFSCGHTMTAAMSMGLAEIAPGGVLALHRHAPAEIYHVLAGTGRCDVEGIAHELRPGVSLHIPADAPHRTSNTGASPLRFLFVFPCDSLDEVVYRFEE